MGRQYRLKVVRGGDGSATLKGGWLVTRAAGSDPTGVRAAVVTWFLQRAALYLAVRLAEVCSRHGLKKPVMVIGEQKSRWGSCDARGTLRVNWRIIQAPVSLVDYVLLHELTHREHPGHDRDFWAALGRRMPDYERRRDRLRALGPDLVW